MTDPRRHVVLIRAGALLLLVSWNLRTVLAIIGAASTQIESALSGGGAAVGAVSTVFVLLSALAALVARQLARRLRLMPVVALSLALITAGHALIALWGAGQLWVAVVAAGLGGGLVGALTPALVSTLLPGRAGSGVAVFMVGNSAGFYAASAAVGWAAERSTWSDAAVPLAATAVVGALISALAARGRRGDETSLGPPSLHPSPRRTPLPTWMRTLVAFLCLQTLSVFALIAWVAPSAEASGAPTSAATTMLGLLSALQIITGIGLPLLAQRRGHGGTWIVASAVAVLAGTLVFTVLVVERAAWTAGWAAVLLIALGHGGAFAMANYLVAALADSERVAVEYGATMMLWSQLAGALGPTLLGAVRDQAGGYPMAWWTLVIVSVAMVGAAWRLAATLRQRDGRAASLPDRA